MPVLKYLLMFFKLLKNNDKFFYLLFVRQSDNT